jgi:hypothetical protein
MSLLDILAQRANIVIILYLLVNFGEYYEQVICDDAG